MSVIPNNTAECLVSVIMPAYNAADYIEIAIRSVMAQTHSRWELLVIDDGSADETREIVRRLAEEDSRIRPICNEQNMGVAETRNRGLSLCQGQFVALLDCDDWWHPEKLEKQLALAQQSGADIVYCSYGIMDANGEKLCEDFLVPDATDYKKCLVQSVISCSTALLSQEIAEKYRFSATYYHEDLVLWLELLRDGYTARGAEEVLAKYRVAQGSRASNKLKSAIERWKICRQCMKEPLFASIGVLYRYGMLAIKKYRKV